MPTTGVDATQDLLKYDSFPQAVKTHTLARYKPQTEHPVSADGAWTFPCFMSGQLWDDDGQ